MRTKIFYIVLMIIAFPFLTGMGGKGGGFERAPRVEKNFSVIVTDTAGNKIEGEKFSWEGRIHFAGYMGMASVVMPFDRIREVSVGEKKERKVRVIAKLTDGSETSFDVDADARCYGEASFGSFMLMMEEIRTITFKKTVN